jgi:molybdenum cofactor cytidylyltransferase
MIFAVIPAAGKSVRMGRPKIALPVGERTVLECVIAALRQAEIEHILVVLGPHMASLASLAESAGAHTLTLQEETADMRATLVRGLDWLEERFHPTPEDAILLVPADHPTLEAAIVAQLLQARADDPQKRIFVPTYAGRRGHPTLIAWSEVACIRAMPAGKGLNQYLRERPADVMELPTRSSQVLRDLDTPEEYEALLKRFPSKT